MIRPDLKLICENMLMSEGFQGARVLAIKFVTLYELSSELLSKQVILLYIYIHMYFPLIFLYFLTGPYNFFTYLSKRHHYLNRPIMIGVCGL
jgi:hypothetical protein